MRLLNPKIDIINLERRDRNWFRLDNAGKLYPALISGRQTTLFRVSADLTAPIRVTLLQKALSRTMGRFPYYHVFLKQGLFWFFFESGGRSPRVERDSLFPCMHYPLKDRSLFPFRVRAFKNRIAVEFSHVMTDGTGAIRFLEALLIEYFRDLDLAEGKTPPQADNLPHAGELPDPEEYEDAFRKYYKPDIPLPPRGERAFHLDEPLLFPGKYYILTGIVPVDALKKLATEYKVSLTELLVAFMIDAFQTIQERRVPRPSRRKPIRISVPINLRNLYPSKTMRNFFLSVEPSIDPRLGHYGLEEIAGKVHYFMKYVVDKKFLNQQITRNIRGEMNMALRLMPLILKNMLLPPVYYYLAELNYTSGFSNLGKVELPAELADRVTRFEFIPPPSPGTRTKAGVVSWKDNCYISFGRLIEDPVVEREFFRSLRKRGIPVKIEYNWGG
jgi:hypothetical protein